MSTVDKTRRIGRWYFGGTASAMAACCTHPLDLLKVHLQTQQKGKIGLIPMGVKVFKTDGILGLYNGLSASILRQVYTDEGGIKYLYHGLSSCTADNPHAKVCGSSPRTGGQTMLTYSLTRFGIYETVKKELLARNDGAPMPFYQKVLVAGFAGMSGGFVGTPADMVNVRMQNDVKLPREQRRNYKHGFDGLWQVYKNEGPTKMFAGATMASSRAVLVTIGQLAFYDQIKYLLMKTVHAKDTLTTHFTCSFLAGAIATLLTMPLDVMKTRMMNAKPGTYSSILACGVDIAKNGPMGFFKGFIPAFVRLGPHTILTFVFFEQIRQNFGYDPPAAKE